MSPDVGLVALKQLHTAPSTAGLYVPVSEERGVTRTSLGPYLPPVAVPTQQKLGLLLAQTGFAADDWAPCARSSTAAESSSALGRRAIERTLRASKRVRSPSVARSHSLASKPRAADDSGPVGRQRSTLRPVVHRRSAAPEARRIPRRRKRERAASSADNLARALFGLCACATGAAACSRAAGCAGCRHSSAAGLAQLNEAREERRCARTTRAAHS